MTAAPLGAPRDERPGLRLLGPEDAADVTEPAANGSPASRAMTVALVALEAKRNDDLREAETRRQDDLRDMTTKYQAELSIAEAKRLDANAVAEARRIDAVIASDRAAVLLATSRAELTATALRETVDVSAKTLASQVEASAKALRDSNEASTTALVGRIIPLEQARYEQAGGKVQQSESRQFSQWTFERVLTVIGLVAGVAYFVLNNVPAR